MRCQSCGKPDAHNAGVPAPDFDRERDSPEEEDRKQNQNQAGAEEPEFFPRHAEDEVRPLLWDEVQLRLGSAEVSLPEQPSGPDGHLGLHDVIACPQGIDSGSRNVAIRFCW